LISENNIYRSLSFQRSKSYIYRAIFTGPGSEKLKEEKKQPLDELFGTEPKIQKQSRDAKEIRNDKSTGPGVEMKKKGKSDLPDIQDMQYREKNAEKPDVRSQMEMPSKESLDKFVHYRGEFNNADLNAFKKEGEEFGGPARVGANFGPKVTESNQQTAQRNYEIGRTPFEKELAEDQKAGRLAYENSEFGRNKYNPDYFREKIERGEMEPHHQGRQYATGEPLEAVSSTVRAEDIPPGGIAYEKLSINEIERRKEKYSGDKIPKPSNIETPRAPPPMSNAEQFDEKRATMADLERTAFESAAVLKEGIESLSSSVKEGAQRLEEKVIGKENVEVLKEKVKEASTTVFEKVSSAVKYAAEGAKESIEKGKEKIQKMTDEKEKK